MIELTPELMKILAPVIAWATWATRMIYKNQRDIDLLYYFNRGKCGLRDRSIKGRFRRLINKGKRHGEYGGGTSRKSTKKTSD